MMSLYQMIILSSTRLLRIISGVNMCFGVNMSDKSCSGLCLGYSCSPACLLQASSASCLQGYRNYHHLPCLRYFCFFAPFLVYRVWYISLLGLHELHSTGAIGIFLAGLHMLDKFFLQSKEAIESKFLFLFSKSQEYSCFGFCKGMVQSSKMSARSRTPRWGLQGLWYQCRSFAKVNLPWPGCPVCCLVKHGHVFSLTCQTGNTQRISQYG